LVLTFLKMKETHHDTNRTPVNLRNTLQSMWQMLKAPSFMLALIPVIAFYAVQGAFLAAVPFILMGEYGLDPVIFGLSNVNIVIGLFSGRYLGMYVLKKYGAAAVYRYGGYLAICVSLLFIFMAMGIMGGLWPFLIISGIFATLFGMMAPLGMKTSISAFRSVSGVAAAVQSSLLFTASALGSAMVGFLMYTFHDLSAETVFALVTILLCLIAAGAAFKNKMLQ